MIRLKSATKVEVKSSPIHGMGVFAIEEIKAGELIEECHLIPIPDLRIQYNKMIGNFMHEYSFRYPSSITTEQITEVLPLGNGCIYNHSDDNNAVWRDHPEYFAFQYIAKRDINVGEEICTYYGDQSYWEFQKNFKEINKSII